MKPLTFGLCSWGCDVWDYDGGVTVWETYARNVLDCDGVTYVQTVLGYDDEGNAFLAIVFYNIQDAALYLLTEKFKKNFHSRNFISII